MPDYYILNEAPVIQADNAKQAARKYARQVGLAGGAVLVASASKTFAVTGIPADVEAVEQ